MKMTTIFFAMFLSVSGCRSTQQTTADSGKKMLPPVVTEMERQKLAEGIDFYAKGVIPASWTLEMDWGNTIRFRSIDGTEANSTPVQGTPLTTGNGTRYVTPSTYGELVIDILNIPCMNASSGEKFNKTVYVNINKKKYEGCGTYLFNPALDGKWVVVKIDNKSLDVKDYARGLPQINIDLSTQRASGNDGCNTFSSGIEIQGNKIKFNAIISTKMACPGNASTTDLLQKLDGHFSGYSFSGAQLILYLYDDSTLYLDRQ